MAGYGDRLLAVSTGVHDPLMAKALILKDNDTGLAIVTMDLIGAPFKSVDVIKEAIRDKLGIDQVMLLASHTHSGPEGSPAFPGMPLFQFLALTHSSLMVVWRMVFPFAAL